MGTTNNYAIGHNLSGYSPDSDSTYIVETWEEAMEALKDEMRGYADMADESAWEQLYSMTETMLIADYPTTIKDGHVVSVDFGDDTPSMLATVESIITDEFPWFTANGKQTHAFANGAPIGFHVVDNDGRFIYFWIAPTDETPED